MSGNLREAEMHGSVQGDAAAGACRLPTQRYLWTIACGAQSRHEARPRLHVESVRSVNRSALERRVATPDQAALDKGRQPGGLAAAAPIALHGFDDVEFQRHRGARAPALRQGDQSVPPRSSSKRWASAISGETIRPAAVCVYHPFVATAVEAVQAAPASMSPPSPPAFPHGLTPLSTRLAGDRGLGGATAPTRSTSSSRAAWCSGPNGSELYNEIKSRCAPPAVTRI
jgi:hypothetical protein